ncbi:energy transducer TonB, partial [Rhodopila globiformis]|uniref:energy transducer TonB n=1 Tax=Rhodopila globiformis TaxID=1071 RepID=UPI00195D1190
AGRPATRGTRQRRNAGNAAPHRPCLRLQSAPRLSRRGARPAPGGAGAAEADGHPQAVSVARGSGFPLLDQAAVAAVRGWRFIPARQGAEAVAARVLVPIIFKLRT